MRARPFTRGHPVRAAPRAIDNTRNWNRLQPSAQARRQPGFAGSHIRRSRSQLALELLADDKFGAKLAPVARASSLSSRAHPRPQCSHRGGRPAKAWVTVTFQAVVGNMRIDWFLETPAVASDGHLEALSLGGAWDRALRGGRGVRCSPPRDSLAVGYAGLRPRCLVYSLPKLSDTNRLWLFLRALFNLAICYCRKVAAHKNAAREPRRAEDDDVTRARCTRR